MIVQYGTSKDTSSFRMTRCYSMILWDCLKVEKASKILMVLFTVQGSLLTSCNVQLERILYIHTKGPNTDETIYVELKSEDIFQIVSFIETADAR